MAQVGVTKMTELASSALLGKLLSGIAGLFGGLSVSFFWQPKKLHQHGKLAAGAIIGGISVGSSFALGGFFANMAGIDLDQSDTALGIGYAIGACSVGVISFLANFFEKREGSDLLEVADELRNSRRTVKKTVRKKKSGGKTND